MPATKIKIRPTSKDTCKLQDSNTSFNSGRSDAGNNDNNHEYPSKAATAEFIDPLSEEKERSVTEGKKHKGVLPPPGLPPRDQNAKLNSSAFQHEPSSDGEMIDVRPVNRRIMPTKIITNPYLNGRSNNPNFIIYSTPNDPYSKDGYNRLGKRYSGYTVRTKFTDNSPGASDKMLGLVLLATRDREEEEKEDSLRCLLEDQSSTASVSKHMAATSIEEVVNPTMLLQPVNYATKLDFFTHQPLTRTALKQRHNPSRQVPEDITMRDAEMAKAKAETICRPSSPSNIFQLRYPRKDAPTYTRVVIALLNYIQRPAFSKMSEVSSQIVQKQNPHLHPFDPSAGPIIYDIFKESLPVRWTDPAPEATYDLHSPFRSSLPGWMGGCADILRTLDIHIPGLYALKFGIELKREIEGPWVEYKLYVHIAAVDEDHQIISDADGKWLQVRVGYPWSQGTGNRDYMYWDDIVQSLRRRCKILYNSFGEPRTKKQRERVENELPKHNAFY